VKAFRNVHVILRCGNDATVNNGSAWLSNFRVAKHRSYSAHKNPLLFVVTLLFPASSLLYGA